MMNRKTVIEWEIQLTDEQAQRVCQEAEEWLCSTNNVNSINEVDTEILNEDEWAGIIGNTLYDAEIYNDETGLNEVFFRNGTQYFGLERIPSDLVYEFYNHITNIVKEYIYNRKKLSKNHIISK